MKKLIALLGLSVLFVLPSFAQQELKEQRFKDRDPKEMAEKMTARMGEKLNLTEAQLQQIEPLILEFHQKEIEARKAHRAERKNFVSQMKEILTEEQFAKFEKHFKQRAKMRRERGGALPLNESEE